MRVTKIIREYVEDKVNKVYQPQIDAIRLRHKPIQEEIEAQLAELRKATDKTAATIIAKYPDFTFTCGFGGDMKYIRSYASLEYKNRHIRSQEEQDLLDARNNKIQEILVSLEMGASKDDLDKMLKEL